MLWPIVLPFQLTGVAFLLVVVLLTATRTPRKWSRIKTLLISSIAAIVLFIPSCTGVMLVTDSIRFGHFHYDSFEAIPDFRSQRYLPTAASNIEMHKHANGYRARYDISAADFEAYLDGLWTQYGEHSAVERGGFMDEGQTVSPELFNHTFDGLNWTCPATAIVYYSPSEGDGGGATYYYDADAGLMFQRTGFW
ncbi:hypothetical protein [Rhodopirellula sallentina]|nr:hypothetical protein [Rhodopirellula sallentina]